MDTSLKIFSGTDPLHDPYLVVDMSDGLKYWIASREMG